MALEARSGTHHPGVVEGVSGQQNEGGGCDARKGRQMAREMLNTFVNNLYSMLQVNTLLGC
jgi:membrane protease subunit (stomatin/prohibitin family)